MDLIIMEYLVIYFLSQTSLPSILSINTLKINNYCAHSKINDVLLHSYRKCSFFPEFFCR